MIQGCFEELNLTILWQNPCDNINYIDYTYNCVMDKKISFSTIDHFASSSRLFQSITEADVIHSGLNFSNHSPIFVKFNCGNLNLKMETVNIPCKVSWAKATEDSKV